MAVASRNHFFRSLVLFLLNDVEEDTLESSLALYDRWSKKTNLVIKSPEVAAWTLEYLERTKNIDRRALLDAAIIDGYIAPQQRIFEGSRENGKEKDT